MILADTNTDAVTKATLHAVLYVVDNITHERAILLPWVSQVFLATYTTESKRDQIVLEVGEGTVKYTTRWLLSQLILHLEPYIEFKCIHKKFGTVIFRRGGDLLTSLSWALGRAQLKDPVDECMHIKINNTSRRPCVLREAGDMVNDSIHAEIAKHNTEKNICTRRP